MDSSRSPTRSHRPKATINVTSKGAAQAHLLAAAPAAHASLPSDVVVSEPVELPGDVAQRALSALDAIGDETQRRAVLELFERARRSVRDDGINLVVLCARRLPCLYTVLLDAGLPPITGALVVSDRYFDVVDIASQKSWRKVLILDDTVVLGTTLARLFDRIAEALPHAEITTDAVIVDEEKRAGFLLEHVNLAPHALRLPSAEVDVFSADVVRVLFHNLAPFFSDFPVSRRLEISTTDLLALIESDDWRSADVTTSLLAADHQAAYVQLPGAELDQSLRAALPHETARVLSAFKLRIYVSGVSDDACEVRLVPLALLTAVTDDELNQAAAALNAHAVGTATASATWDTSGCVAKHRLLQLMVSQYLLAVALPDLVSIAGEPRLNTWVDGTYVNLYFGDQADRMTSTYTALQIAGRAIAEELKGSKPEPLDELTAVNRPSSTVLMDDDELRVVLWAEREVLQQIRHDEPDLGGLTKIGVVAAHAVNSIFGFVSTRLEAQQQEHIRGLATYDDYRAEFEGNDQRVLDHVFTIDDLATLLVADRAATTVWDRSLVSLGIDVGNDLGIAVPATRVDQSTGLIYRGYRMGETAHLVNRPFAEIEQGPLDLQMLDLLGQTIAEAPIAPEPGRPRLPGGRAEAGDAHQRVAELESLLRDALPGEIVARYTGDVYGVNDKTFLARLVSVPDYEEYDYEIDVSLVPVDQAALLKPGAWFRMTNFALSDGTIHSRVVIERPKRLGTAAMAGLLEDLTSELSNPESYVEQASKDGPNDSRLAHLTERERAVVLAIAEGISVPQTAARLFISTGSVKGSLARIYRKLGVESESELASLVAPPSGGAK